jgi:hypothetical protein
MRIHLPLSIFFLSCLLATNSFAKKLDVYYCKSLADAESCSANCKNTLLKDQKYNSNDAQRVEFFVNEKNNTVLEKTYFGEKLSSSRIEKNCRIFDKNNWDCSDEPIWIAERKWFVIQTDKMIDGIYINGLRTSKETIHTSISASCAK